MQKKENYKLAGVIKSYNYFSDFVRPVFEKEGKYYFVKGKLGEIHMFTEIKKEMYDRIIKIEDVIVGSNINLKSFYQIGDSAIICFRLDNDNYFISDVDNFILFIENYQTDDEMLKEDIEDLIYRVKLKNKIKKKMLYI